MAWACGKWRGPLVLVVTDVDIRLAKVLSYLQVGGGALREAGSAEGVRGGGGAWDGAEDGA